MNTIQEVAGFLIGYAIGLLVLGLVIIALRILWDKIRCGRRDKVKIMGRVVDTSRFRYNPWPQDIHIDPVIYYDSQTGEEQHYVTAHADGPNPDGETCHHAFGGYWDGFTNRRELYQFSARLAQLITRLTGCRPRIYLTQVSRSLHAGWCLHENSHPPRGVDYDEFIALWGKD